MNYTSECIMPNALMHVRAGWTGWKGLMVRELFESRAERARALRRTAGPATQAARTPTMHGALWRCVRARRRTAAYLVREPAHARKPWRRKEENPLCVQCAEHPCTPPLRLPSLTPLAMQAPPWLSVCLGMCACPQCCACILMRPLQPHALRSQCRLTPPHRWCAAHYCPPGTSVRLC